VSLRLALATVGLVVAVTGLVATGVRSGPPSTAPGLDGRDLFVAKGCSACHTGPDSTSAFGVGPPLVDVASWAGSRRPGADATAYLTESLRDPGAYVSPARRGDAEMPALTLTDAEIDQLVGYLLEP
jgi:mono/diheme cytochrome c family protein